MWLEDPTTWLEDSKPFCRRFDQLSRLMPKNAPILMPADYAEIGLALGNITFGAFYNATASILEIDDSFPSIARILKICRFYKEIPNGKSPQRAET